MGKASRKKNKAATKVVPAPFVVRPFEGLKAETDLVAMRELLPAATACVTLAKPDVLLDAMEKAGVDGGAMAACRDSLPKHLTLTTILPMGWPGLRRADGEALVGLQTGSTSGDASRDVAMVALHVLAAQPGTPIPNAPSAVYATPRLQDIIDVDADISVELHDTFEYWMTEDAELDEAGRESLNNANETIIPTARLEGAPSAFWFEVGDRCYLRYLLSADEDRVTDGLARLQAAGEQKMGDAHFLGAFRACGLLVPVWDLDPKMKPAQHAKPMAELAARLDDAIASTEPLSSEERRAKAEIVSRQLTLR